MDVTATEHYSTWIKPLMDEQLIGTVPPPMNVTAIEHYRTWTLSPIEVTAKGIFAQILKRRWMSQI